MSENLPHGKTAPMPSREGDCILPHAKAALVPPVTGNKLLPHDKAAVTLHQTGNKHLPRKNACDEVLTTSFPPMQVQAVPARTERPLTRRLPCHTIQTECLLKRPGPRGLLRGTALEHAKVHGRVASASKSVRPADVNLSSPAVTRAVHTQCTWHAGPQIEKKKYSAAGP